MLHFEVCIYSPVFLFSNVGMKLRRDQTVRRAARSTRRRSVASESITTVFIVLLLLLIGFSTHFISQGMQALYI